MSDRELLELAAKAHGNIFFIARYFFEGIENTDHVWNPLIDDRDALRLAVKLNLHVGIECESAGTIAVEWIFDEGGTAAGYIEQDAPADGDDYAATRRAIVRAAAEIGKAMQG